MERVSPPDPTEVMEGSDFVCNFYRAAFLSFEVSFKRYVRIMSLVPIPLLTSF